MSAGFDFRGKDFWGTNGAVEAYVGALASQAATLFGPDDPLSIFFRDERDGYFTGKYVFLDPILVDPASRRKFVQALDAATERLLREDTFTDNGLTWVDSTIWALRQHVVDADLWTFSGDG